MTTTVLGLVEISVSQSQKEVTHNEALQRLEGLVQVAVISPLAVPPVGVEGAAYIVIATATLDWLGHEDDVAFFQNGAWSFVTPWDGFEVFDKSNSWFTSYNGANWTTDYRARTATIGTETDTFSSCVLIQRNAISIGALDNSGSNVRLKALTNNSAMLVNDSNLGVEVNEASEIILGTGAAVPYMPSFTVATLPSVTKVGGFIYVSDEVGGATMAFSNGTNWLRVQDRAIVA